MGPLTPALAFPSCTWQGIIQINGEKQEGNLMEHVGATLKGALANDNGVINFHGARMRARTRTRKPPRDRGAGHVAA